MIRTISLFLALSLAGCATGPRPSVTTAPACEALIGPIRYNSFDAKSRRYAGPDLAPDIAKRNRVGRNLRCPQYR